MDGIPIPTDPARSAVPALHGVSEADALLAMLPAALVEALRAQARRSDGIEHFLQEYQLSTPEDMTLFCLAEAFLRIPDPLTADALIRDKLGAGDWASHVGHSPSALVNCVLPHVGHHLAFAGRGLDRQALRRPAALPGAPRRQAADARRGRHSHARDGRPVHDGRQH